MLVEVLLVSIILVAGYQGFLVLRRGHPGQRLYAWLLFGNAVLAVAAVNELADEHALDSRGDLLAFLAVAVFLCLVMVPPILRDLARRAVARDRIGAARALLGVRELLQPGFGAAQEREFLDSISAVRAGRVDDVLVDLKKRRSQLQEPLHRRVYDERIVLTLLYARRWEDAVTHFEHTLDSHPGPTTAQLCVELIRAYGELDRLDRAAALLARLEGTPHATEPALLFLVARARMVFLAFAGRAREVEALLGPAGPLRVLPPAARAYWTGVARLNAGDRAGAEAALHQAVDRAGRDTRARVIAQETLAALADAMVDGPRTVSPQLEQLVDTVAGAATRPVETPASAVPRFDGSIWSVAPVTAVIIGVNVAVFAAVSFLLGSTQDAGVLAAAGANMRMAVVQGEWWRLMTATVLHAGAIHVFLNLYGLWILGRMVEQIFGRTRYFAIYVLSGLGGSLASLWFAQAPVSVGASGAVMGLLGAAVAEFALRRAVYPDPWRRAVLGSLLFVVIANLAIGAVFPIIDQSAHIGGMVTGAVLGAILAPRARFGRSILVRALAAILFSASAAAVAYAATGAYTNLTRSEWRPHVIGGITVDTPPAWYPDGEGLMGSSSLGYGRVLWGSTEEVDPLEGDTVKAAFPDVAGWTRTERKVRSTEQKVTLHVAMYTRPGMTLVFVAPLDRPDDVARHAARVVASAHM